MRRDRHLIFASSFLRSLATGAIGVLIGIHLSRLNFDPLQVGAVIGSGLVGNGIGALVSFLWGDRAGRRRLLAAAGVLTAAGGVGLALGSEPWLLTMAALVGMVNGMGRERGAPMVIEQAVIPQVVEPRRRTSAFAWYNVSGDIGHGLGALLAALPTLLHTWWAFSVDGGVRITLVVCALLVLATVPMSFALSPAVERTGPAASQRPPLLPRSRQILLRISALFALDSVAGGFVTTAWLALYFHTRFEASPAAIGALFLGARLINAVSHLAAARIARKIGLVNTMVFTHTPSSLLLLTILFAPSLPVAAVLFLAREGLSTMDVPTRQSWLMAVVAPRERLLASGVTHLVRLGGWAAAPFVAGALASRFSLGAPIVAGVAMKIVYDVLLWLSFHDVRAPEEERPAAEVERPVAAIFPERRLAR
jgi:MFS family permease